MKRLATTLAILFVGAAPTFAQGISATYFPGTETGLTHPNPYEASGGFPVHDTSRMCGANLYQHLVGQPLSYAHTAGATHGARILQFGQVRNFNHIADRLNFEIHLDQTVFRVFCG
ncbi:I78 family peptidase inhibitor [Nioella sp. MMSF_3534]|uniref:I78 family peptidase inhibitor n=1 Tax=Nioella sp. MMSF_3534 TaxID=3046720 RepID=UPI00273FE271|nr:I78 family peptidase inhibitor [Nioella sp. MMSF_3534]